MDTPNQQLLVSQTRAIQAPETAYTDFLKHVEKLSPVEQKSLIASRADQINCTSKLLEHSSDTDKPLRGLTYVLQDIFDAPGHPTTCGAPFVDAFEGTVDDASTLYERLDACGATLMAKTVPAEFGVDPRGRNQHYGDLQHPLGAEYTAGGGSGTSVRAVQAGLAPVAFGVDSCGGMRIPCAFQGCFGFRMGQNALIQHGVFPVMPSVESIAWAAKDLTHLRLVYAALYPTATENCASDIKGVYIDDAGCRVAPTVKASLRPLTQALEIDEDPSLQTALRRAFKGAGNALQLLQSRELYTIHQYWVDEYREHYDAYLLRRIYRGMECSTTEVEQSNQTQEHIRHAIAQLFQTHDFLIMPVSPIPTPTQEEWNIDLEADLMQLNAPASLGVHSALIIPTDCGNNRSAAAQIIVPPNRPEVVYALLDALAATAK